MSNIGLEFAKVATEIGSAPTESTKKFSIIAARTDGTLTYTEVYEDGEKTFTGESITAGQVFYGTFHTISTSTGHIVASR